MKKWRLILIILSVLILLGTIGMTSFLLFFNYKNVRLFKQAQNNFQRGDDASLSLAEKQLLQVVRKDGDNEAAFVMLGEIARKKKIYPEQVYYCYMAYRLNPLSSEHKERYIQSLCFARYFDRLEFFLGQGSSLSDRHRALLHYAAGRNRNISKYKLPKSKTGNLDKLTSLLFEQKKLSPEETLAALDRIVPAEDVFLQQEICVAETDLFVSMQKMDEAEKSLLQAYQLNEYAFAPALGRFYANYYNLGKALKVFEKHLAVYHDQSVAMQCAEIYCLLNQSDKIAALRKDYQSDSGTRGLLCDYYLEALAALAQKDVAALKELAEPLRNNVNTPLAAFMFFCVDAQEGDLRSIQASYKALLAHRNYLNLQEQADNILADFLKKSLAAGKTPDQLVSLAVQLYGRKKDPFIAKLILLAQKRSRSVNPVILKDAVKRFGNDPGVVKLAIEYYLTAELSEAERLIALYKQKFAAKANETLRYEIVLNVRKKNFDRVSELFRKNFSAEILPEYWQFASSTMREADLVFLSKNKFYEPYCKALLLLKAKKKQQAALILKDANADKDPSLLFFAAKVLAENGYHQEALKKYEQIPESSPLKLTVFLNMAEIHSALGNLDQALIFANRAYSLAPEMAETQLCYADKLHKKGQLSSIPKVIKLSTRTSQRRKLESLWIAGMEQCIKECCMKTQQEKILGLCDQLLRIEPNNKIANEYRKAIKPRRQ